MYALKANCAVFDFAQQGHDQTEPNIIARQPRSSGIYVFVEDDIPTPFQARWLTIMTNRRASYCTCLMPHTSYLTMYYYDLNARFRWLVVLGLTFQPEGSLTVNYDN